MALQWRLLVLFMIFLSSSSLTYQQVVDYANFDVLQFGAVGDGMTDDTNAFLAAWSSVCVAVGMGASLTIPAGKTFLVFPVQFQGPCNSSSTRFQVDGNLVAPNFNQWSDKATPAWITFWGVNGLVVNGTGEINGQGADWWQMVNTSNKNVERPKSLQISGCNNLQLSGISFKDSPRNHISILGCTGVTVSHLTINAPEDSPNTDGIDISHSENIQVDTCVIATGDDCIAIGAETFNMNVTSVACGPGHGISIGSLGQGGAEQSVHDVNVLHCNFTRTLCGARIKTWQGGSGTVKSITFGDITLNEARNPIIIDQYYCGAAQGCAEQPKAVQVTNVTFDGFRGTSATEAAIQLKCSNSVGCTGIVLNNINLQPAQVNGLSSTCINAHGIATATTPAVNCLSP